VAEVAGYVDAWFNKWTPERARRVFGDVRYMPVKPMAASAESLVYFANLVDPWESLVLDAGAGLSSVLLRAMLPNVVTVELDGIYRDEVHMIVAELGLRAAGGFSGVVDRGRPVKYSFYDLGRLKDRPTHFAAVVDKTETAVYVDDCGLGMAGTELYRRFVEDYCRANGHRLEDAPETLDSIGRSGAVLWKGQG
jgi:hypothetical protein